MGQSWEAQTLTVAESLRLAALGTLAVRVVPPWLSLTGEADSKVVSQFTKLVLQ